MAIVKTLTPEQQQALDAWISERPPEIQAMIKKLPPDRLYLNKKSGHRMTIVSYHSDNTVIGTVLGKYNQCAFERNVFGIPVDDLEECDLPVEGEPLGAKLTDPEAVDAFIELARPFVMPGK